MMLDGNFALITSIEERKIQNEVEQYRMSLISIKFFKMIKKVTNWCTEMQFVLKFVKFFLDTRKKNSFKYNNRWRYKDISEKK